MFSFGLQLQLLANQNLNILIRKLIHISDAYGSRSQEYVSKLLKQNFESNSTATELPKNHKYASKKNPSFSKPPKFRNPDFLALDWETDSVDSLPALLNDSNNTIKSKIDAVLACDCIYNESLIAPFVRTCGDLSHLADGDPSGSPTICIIAQQLRSPDVFEAWLVAFMEIFRVWRVPDRLLTENLMGNSGFVIHVGLLRSSLEKMESAD